MSFRMKYNTDSNEDEDEEHNAHDTRDLGEDWFPVCRTAAAMGKLLAEATP